MSKESLIVVPGLDDGSFIAEMGSRNLRRRLNAEVEVHTMPWQGEEQDLDPKLERLLNRIDELTKEGRRVSLLGISAGGSAVLNAFTLRQDEVSRVVNVCGRLRAGIDVSPTLDEASKKSPSFKESVLLFEEKEKSLSMEARSNVLTIRPIADEIVPVSTMTLEGATNVRVISVEHMLSIALATTLYSDHIVNFIDEDKRED